LRAIRVSRRVWKHTHTHTHTHWALSMKLARSAVVGLGGWHSWRRPSTLGTISLVPCRSQPTLVTFKFAKLYWRAERGHCGLPSRWETKYNADLSRARVFSNVPAPVNFSVTSGKVFEGRRKKNVILFSGVNSSPPVLSRSRLQRRDARALIASL